MLLTTLIRDLLKPGNPTRHTRFNDARYTTRCAEGRRKKISIETLINGFHLIYFLRQPINYTKEHFWYILLVACQGSIFNLYQSNNEKWMNICISDSFFMLN